MSEEKKRSAGSYIFLFLVGFGPFLIYTFIARPWADIWEYSLLISAVFTIIALAAILLDKRRIGKSWLFTIGMAVFIIAPALIGGVFIGLLYYSIGVAIKDLFLWGIDHVTDGTWGPIIVSLLTLTAGTVLFFFRLRFRCVYGLSEAVVGILIAQHKIADYSTTQASSDFYIAFLTASIYLVVRGFDNVHQGFTKDPIVKAMRKWLRKKTQSKPVSTSEAG